MIWPIVVIGLVGIVVGMRFRPPALILIAGIAMIVSIVSGFIGNATWPAVILSTVAGVLAVNCGYVLGAYLRVNTESRLRRAGAPRRSRAVSG